MPGNWNPRGRSVLLLLGAILLAAPGALPAAEALTCGPGLTVALSARRARQGDLIEVELSSTRAISGLSGQWQSRSVPFWELPPEEISPSPRKAWRGLVGIDLETEQGSYDLQILQKQPGGTALRCRVPVSIRKANFLTERLQVEKQFTQPSPEQLERASRETQRLRAIFDSTTTEKLWDGPFRLPLEGAPKGSNFGKRRVLNGKPSSPHSGVDFPSPPGTPVLAAQRGRVVLAEPLYFSGNTVVLDHGFGIYSFYGHLSQIAVRPGELVEAGSELGRVGATGRVTGPHLHWGLTVRRARVDPQKLVAFSTLR